MKAWQFTNTHEPLVLAEVDKPTPGPGQVVLEMKAAGICHTDVGQMSDEAWLSVLAKTPITMGHENAGVVAELGEGVTDFTVGDRVGVCPTTSVGAPGHNYDGGFASHLLVDAQTLVPLPDNVDFVMGAAATDAGMTSHAAVVTSGGVQAGDVVGIIGLGGLGQIGARVAVLTGADVYVAEVNEKVWPLAEKLGAKGVRSSITEFGDVSFDVIVDFAGFGTTTAQAIDVIGEGGTVVLVGMGRLESTINTQSLIMNSATLVGNKGGTKKDIAGIYKFMASGDLNPTITTIGFDQIPEGIQKLKNGEVIGRLVASFE